MNVNVNSISGILHRAKNILKEADIYEYEQDSWLLLEYVFGINRQKYYINPDFIPEQCDIEKYFELINMRATRKPLQYITGTCEFMGLTFGVCKDVLIPRQDTEILVECAIQTIDELCAKKGIEPRMVRVLDMCTGSGCIGISIARLTGAAVTCADVSNAALKCAGRNAEKLCGDNIEFICTDLFENIYNTYDIIVSNPPYIRKNEIEKLMPEVRDFEPRLALDGEDDGLKFYRKITSDSGEYLNEGGTIIYEIGCEQAADVSYILKENNYNNIEIIKDLAGLDRVVKAGKEKK